MGDFTNVPGGFPIEIDGEVIGAVAAGGARSSRMSKWRWRRCVRSSD